MPYDADSVLSKTESGIGGHLAHIYRCRGFRLSLTCEFLVLSSIRRGGRVVEGGSLENCCGGNSTPGSNPGLSAMLKKRAKLKVLKHTETKT